MNLYQPQHKHVHIGVPQLTSNPCVASSDGDDWRLSVVPEKFGDCIRLPLPLCGVNLGAVRFPNRARVVLSSSRVELLGSGPAAPPRASDPPLAAGEGDTTPVIIVPDAAPRTMALTRPAWRSMVCTIIRARDKEGQ